MTLRRDGTPQRLNPSGMMQTGPCPDCGQVMRLCNIARHRRFRHDPTYVRPSRMTEYRRVHRTQAWTMRQDRHGYYAGDAGELYVIHFARPISDHAGHYMGWTQNLAGRLVAHAQGLGSRLTREAYQQGISFALTWTAPGDRNTERRIKANRKLAELCSICRGEALSRRAEKARGDRARGKLVKAV